MQVLFKLYYKIGNVEVPADSIRYRVIAKSTDAAVATGETDGSGETERFKMTVEKDTYKLLVYCPEKTRVWVEPKTDGRYDDSDTTIDVCRNEKVALQVLRVRVIPYFKARFIENGTRRPFPKAAYTAYALDDNGNEGIASDLISDRPIRGTTDGDGYTDTIYCARELRFRFTIPQVNMQVTSDLLRPLQQGYGIPSVDVPFKTSIAITKQEPQAQAKLAGTGQLPAIVSAADQELLIVPQKVYEDFLAVSGQLDKIMASQHQARLDLSRALESKNAMEIEKAEKNLDKAGEAVKSELNKNFKSAAALKEVYTFEAFGGDKKGDKRLGIRRRFMKTDDYIKDRNSKINKTEFKINITFSSPVDPKTKSTATVEPKKLNVKELTDSFKKIALTTKREWGGDPEVIDLISVAGNQFADSIVKSKSYEVDAQAQWLRFVSCGGVNAEMNWAEGAAKVQGNWQAKAVLCEGKISGRFAVPSLKGWCVQFGEVDLGAIRFLMELSVYGFAGAKVVAAGTVGVALKKTKKGTEQVAYAVKNDGTDSLSKSINEKGMPKFDPTTKFPDIPENLNGATAQIDAFVGVEAGITPAGKIQWLPPQEPDFVSFAEASATGAVSAGAGAKLNLAVYYSDGKFRVAAAARLCFGVGCKGGVEFTVDSTKIAQFVRWMQYQLLHAGFKKLVYISEEAFMFYSKLLVLLISEGIPFDGDSNLPFDGGKRIERWKKETIEKIERITAEVDEGFRRLTAQMDDEKKRQALVDNINRKESGDDWPLFLTPEARGAILATIVYRGQYAHALDTPEVGLSWSKSHLDYLPSSKRAILKVMAGATTVKAWVNTMERMTIDGRVRKDRSPGKNEGDLVRFLNDGLNMPGLDDAFFEMNTLGEGYSIAQPAGYTPTYKGSEYVEKYLELRRKLLEKFPPGYKVSFIGTHEFSILSAANGKPSYDFMDARTLCLGEAQDGDPGSSIA